MLKNKNFLWVILPIILLIFSIPGFTAYYKYTQESGTNFYVGTADKSDALEDTNEMRQIIDDLGALLCHSKRDDSYPKDLTTGGTIQIPETGLKFSNAPANNDIAAYIAGEMTWQTKEELWIDLSLYYLKTEINTQAKVENIWEVTLLNDITGESIGDLGDVDLTDIANLKILKYNSTSGNWECEDDAGGGVDTFGTPEALDIARFTDVDTIEGINYTELKTALALSSDDLSDRATIAMLDEEETVTNTWTFMNNHYINRANDFPTNNPQLLFQRSRDGDPTSNVADGDYLGSLTFYGWYGGYQNYAATIQVVVDDETGEDNVPARLEFWTTDLYMEIDHDGNIKMGDGAWTNYVKVTAGGVMTAEGTASIKATDLVITSQAAGDILYFNGTNWTRLAKGTAGQVLTMNDGATAPEWQTP